jgi:hypothetical protein
MGPGGTCSFSLKPVPSLLGALLGTTPSSRPINLRLTTQREWVVADLTKDLLQLEEKLPAWGRHVDAFTDQLAAAWQQRRTHLAATSQQTPSSQQQLAGPSRRAEEPPLDPAQVLAAARLCFGGLHQAAQQLQGLGQQLMGQHSSSSSSSHGSMQSFDGLTAHLISITSELIGMTRDIGRRYGEVIKLQDEVMQGRKCRCHLLQLAAELLGHQRSGMLQQQRLVRQHQQLVQGCQQLQAQLQSVVQLDQRMMQQVQWLGQEVEGLGTNLAQREQDLRDLGHVLVQLAQQALPEDAAGNAEGGGAAAAAGPQHGGHAAAAAPQDAAGEQLGAAAAGPDQDEGQGDEEEEEEWVLGVTGYTRDSLFNEVVQEIQQLDDPIGGWGVG